MAKAEEGNNRRRGAKGRSAVAAAKRSGPGRSFWMGIGAVAVAGIAILAWQASKPKETSHKIDPNLPKLAAQGYLLGSPAAPVEILEFADFECPSCGQFATITEPDVRTRIVNTGQARIRFLDFPLEIHKNTWDASFAASCANEQGKFWPMHDAIFASQDKWNGEATSRPRKVLGDIAKTLGLDMTMYDSCVESEKYRAQIQANLQEGERRGVNQTPSFVIGNKLVPGGIPFDKFKALVDEAVKDAAANPAAASPLPAATDTKASVPIPAKTGK